MDLNLEILQEFQDKTNFPIVEYFQGVDDFVSNHYNNIILYYSGTNKILNTRSFEKLRINKDETERLFEVIRLNNNNLRNFKYWVLEEKVEQIYTFLLTLENSSKWLRSTRVTNDFSSFIPVDIPMYQGQTLESLSANVLGSNNYDNDWTELAINNELEEEDYTSQGGIIIKANLSKNNKNIKITSIVDTMIDENILGKDLDQKLTYEDDDLKVLTPTDTFTQAINILINLRRGDNPEFRNQGLNEKFIVGSNLNNITYPTLFRDLIQLFKTDDSIKAFSIINIRRETEAVYIEFEVENRLNEIQQVQLVF